MVSNNNVGRDTDRWINLTMLTNDRAWMNTYTCGHNVEIGECTAIAACVAIAGSVKIGKYCLIGGAACISGHIEIADQVVLTGMSGVGHSIREAGVLRLLKLKRRA